MDTILGPIEWVVAWIMVGWHWVFDQVIPHTVGADGVTNYGVNWVLSIIGLVIAIRVLLMPLFVRQIRSSRAMQQIQPQVQKIQAKYKGKTDPVSRQAMTEETMALYKQAGTNPFSSCLPMLLQMPVFFALFRVLNYIPEIATGKHDAIGGMTQELAIQFEQSNIFGAQLSQSFLNGTMAVRVVAGVLIVIMTFVTFMTQHQLTMKNMPQSALDNPMAKQQKMFMYAMPFIYFITGPNFPLGVLIYWLTTNVWSFGQQYYVIHRSPAPGSEAEGLMLDRRKVKAAKRGESEVIEGEVTAIVEAPRGQRQQPVGKARAKAKGTSPVNQASSSGAQAQTSGSTADGGATQPGTSAPKAAPAKTTPAKKKAKTAVTPILLSSGDDLPAPSMTSTRRKKAQESSDVESDSMVEVDDDDSTEKA